MKKLNKVNQIKEKKNKININFNSKYLYVFHKSQMFGKLFKKKLFFFDDDNHLSKKEMSAVMYHENNENIFNLLAISKKKKIKCLLKTIFLFIVLATRGISLKNIAVAILYSKIYFRFEIFRLNLLLFKNLKTVFIDWDTHCPKELILAFEVKGVKTICAQERGIQNAYKYFYNIICDTFLSSIPNMDRVFEEKPFSNVDQVIEFGNYRNDYLFKDKNDEFIKKKYGLNGNQKTVILFPYHTEDKVENQFNEIILNWNNHLNFMKVTYESLNQIKNIKVIYRFKNIDWIHLDEFQSITSKIDNSENMFIDREYSKDFFSYSLARFADIVIGPHSSILDELISCGFKNVLLFDYGYKIKSIIEKLAYKDSDYICKNNAELINKLTLLLNKVESSSIIKQGIDQKTIYKEKLYNILKNQLKL